jgi:ubiquinone/menaquinone biosynthesis C-methylase UbiE
MKMRKSCAAEMYRITKRDGNILWIDLSHVNNANLVKFSKSEVQEYFPKVQFVYQKSVHPKYFRRINGRYAWLAKIIYHFTKVGCESKLIMLRKP